LSECRARRPHRAGPAERDSDFQRRRAGPAGKADRSAAGGLRTRGALLATAAAGVAGVPPDRTEELAAPVTRPPDPPTCDVCALLLALGGTRVAVQFEDAGASGLILQNGRATAADGMVHRPGRVNHCHTNCAAAWEAAPGEYRIQTGYGLLRGVWRRHTWLLDGTGRVVETTVPQERYFGAILDAGLARSFADVGRAEPRSAPDTSRGSC